MVVVASTHEGEEQLIIQALQGQLDDIHLVVVQGIRIGWRDY